MVGLDGRTKLLRDLSTALLSNRKYFLSAQEGKDPSEADLVHIRPGNLVGMILSLLSFRFPTLDLFLQTILRHKQQEAVIS
jgi:hypothetical protein